VRSWGRCLAAAGVGDHQVRADYSAASRYLQRRELVGWGVLRVLLPPESQPHIVAATALACHTDDLCDRGPLAERTQRFDEWAARVATALGTRRSDHPLVRAYLHSADLLDLSRKWIDSYMAGTRDDLAFSGFAQEADYQRYVDRVALPSFMLATQAVPRLVPEHCFAASARVVADGSQRTDFLTDMFEDLRDGRLTLPVCDLDRYGVTRGDLKNGLDTPGVRALISATARSARASLVEGERILAEIAPDYRPFFRCMAGVMHKRLDDVGTRGVAVICHPYHDQPVAGLRVVVHSRRAGASTKCHSRHLKTADPVRSS
jgi:15-cis-phytoene synthase